MDWSNSSSILNIVTEFQEGQTQGIMSFSGCNDATENLVKEQNQSSDGISLEIYDNHHETHESWMKYVSDDTANDTWVASTDNDGIVLHSSFPLESINHVNIEGSNSSLSKRSKKKYNNTTYETGFESKVPKAKFETYHDEASKLGNHQHKRKVSSVENPITDTFKLR